jgi:gluconate 5-dehydrogenase
MTELFDLTGVTALVVGAGGDLGRRSALVLGRQGAHVVAADHGGGADALAETLRVLQSEGISSRSLTCDVTSEMSVDEVVDGVAAEDGLGILVNAAGVMLRKEAVRTTLDEWRKVLDVNLTGTWLLNRAAARHMSVARRGKIINFSSVYAERVGPVPESAYYASKAGVGNLTRSMASELGAVGVHVNCLALGVFYPTNMTAPLKDAPDTLAWMTDRTLLKRLGDPQVDLDGPLLFLASPASDYVTGQIIYVDGGWSSW